MHILDSIYEVIENENKQLFQIWYTQILFTWRWWFQVGLGIVPWILWVKFRDKKNTVRLLFVGLIVALSTNMFDVIGINYNLWHYDWKTLPYAPLCLPFDFTDFPVGVMFFLQIKPKTNAFVKAIIFSSLCSLIFEPLFDWMGIYHPIHWRYIYSFFIYIPLYLFYNFIYNLQSLKMCCKP